MWWYNRQLTRLNNRLEETEWALEEYYNKRYNLHKRAGLLQPSFFDCSGLDEVMYEAMNSDLTNNMFDNPIIKKLML